jgi:hypothetical protein
MMGKALSLIGISLLVAMSIVAIVYKSLGPSFVVPGMTGLAVVVLWMLIVLVMSLQEGMR